MTTKDFLRPFVIGVTTFGLGTSLHAEEQGDLTFASSIQLDASNTFSVSPSNVQTTERTSGYVSENDDIRLTQIIGTQSFIGQLLSEKQF